MTPSLSVRRHDEFNAYKITTLSQIGAEAVENEELCQSVFNYGLELMKNEDIASDIIGIFCFYAIAKGCPKYGDFLINGGFKSYMLSRHVSITASLLAGDAVWKDDNDMRIKGFMNTYGTYTLMHIKYHQLEFSKENDTLKKMIKDILDKELPYHPDVFNTNFKPRGRT